MSIRKTIALLMRLGLAGVITVAIFILVGSSGGCGRGIFPYATSSGSTITPTPVANAFLYATNFTDGTVSSFTRNTSSGALGFISNQGAGALNGPVGIAVTPQNDLAYVANSADNNVYQYSVQQGGSTPGNLSFVGRIAAGTTPQIVAIDSSGSYVYVSNAGSRSVTQYFINSSSTLTLIGTLTGFPGKPFGIVTHPSADFAYVADNVAGLIYAYSIGSSGNLTQIGNPVNSNGSVPGRPSLMAIAADSSSQVYLFVDDMTLGIVSVFVIQSNGGLAYANSYGTGQSANTIGIGAVNNGGSSGNNYVITANQTNSFVQPYLRSTTTLTQLTSAPDITGPTGLTIDPVGLFAYTGNSGSGTIGVLGINNSQCGSLPICMVANYASENPANANAGTQFIATTH